MNILITGATGYVGRNLITYLLSESDYKLFAITRGESNFPSSVTVIKQDVNFDENIVNAKPNVVIHLASHLTSQSEVKDIDNLINANIIFGTKLLNALKRTSLQCFINVGSFAEYHYNDGTLNPTYLYAATKSAYRSVLKYYAELLKFKVVHVIPYTIYGKQNGSKKIMDILFESLNSAELIKMSDGLQSFDFIHIDDVTSFFLQLVKNLSKVSNEEVLHLGTGKSNSIREVANIIQNITDKQINAQWGANLPRERDTIYACAPVGKLKQILNWEAKISIEDGLNIIYNNIK